MKRRYYMILASVPAVLTCGNVFASEASGTANSAVVTAMTSAANDMTATGLAIIPVALGVVTLSLVVTFGIRIFRKVTGGR